MFVPLQRQRLEDRTCRSTRFACQRPKSKAQDPPDGISGIRCLVALALLLPVAVVTVPAPIGVSPSFADGPGGCDPCVDYRPKAQIAIIGAIPFPDGAEGTPTSQDPGENPPAAQDGTGPNGNVTRSCQQRVAELQEEGYDANLLYFSNLEEFSKWATAVKIGLPADCQCPFTHVEIYGHGATHGNPIAGFSTSIPAMVKAYWKALGQALRHIMAGGGHVVFGWCWAADEPVTDYYPAGVVAGEAGAPVYGPLGRIWFPDYDPPWPTGAPYSQPHPEEPTGSHDPSPPANPNPEGGWHRFPPTVKPDPGPPVPNGTTTVPVPPEVVQPGDLDNGGKAKLPRHPADPKQPPVELKDGDGNPLTNPATGEPLVDPQGDPLWGPPPDPDGRPREDPFHPGTPLTQPHNGEGFGPHEGRPFGGPAPDRPPPTPDCEPHPDPQ